jgi:hypothetical protein
MAISFRSKSPTKRIVELSSKDTTEWQPQNRIESSWNEEWPPKILRFSEATEIFRDKCLHFLVNEQKNGRANIDSTIKNQTYNWYMFCIPNCCQRVLWWTLNWIRSWMNIWRSQGHAIPENNFSYLTNAQLTGRTLSCTMGSFWMHVRPSASHQIRFASNHFMDGRDILTWPRRPKSVVGEIRFCLPDDQSMTSVSSSNDISDHWQLVRAEWECSSESIPWNLFPN